MKTSEIEVALRANPQTLFWSDKLTEGYLRITKVDEKITAKTYRSPERRTVTFAVETLKTTKTKTVEDNGSYRWVDIEPVVTIEAISWGIKPQDISHIVHEQKTLEVMCQIVQEQAVKQYYQNIKDREETTQLLEELMTLTGLDKYTLLKTPKKVLEVLREALKK